MLNTTEVFFKYALKSDPPNRKGSSFNHHLSGASCWESPVITALDRCSRLHCFLTCFCSWIWTKIRNIRPFHCTCCFFHCIMVFAIILVMNYWSAYLASVEFDHFINLKPRSTCAQRPREMVGPQLTHTHTHVSVCNFWGNSPNSIWKKSSISQETMRKRSFSWCCA